MKSVGCYAGPDSVYNICSGCLPRVGDCVDCYEKLRIRIGARRCRIQLQYLGALHSSQNRGQTRTQRLRMRIDPGWATDTTARSKLGSNGLTDFAPCSGRV
eukprot:3607470-Rhodomonas_salina.1